MLVGRLRCLPSARDLCIALFAVACGLQASGWLPDPSWLPVLGWALGLSAGMSLLLWWGRARFTTGGTLARAGNVASVAARLLLATLAAAVLVLGQVQRSLDARLPPHLEGAELEIKGRVEGMPQRFVFGDRVRFVVVACRPVAPGAAEGCGRLERVQLDWGSPRERDRGGGNAVWAHPGTWWRLGVRLKRPVAPVNSGAFDLELRLLQQGIGAVGRVRARERLPGRPERTGGWAAGVSLPGWPGAALLIAFEDWRTRLRDHLERAKALHVDATDARDSRWPLMGIVTGLSLGDQGAIGAALWGLFSRTGVSHLMAILYC